MSKPKGLFVTGTDTGVGKTLVTGAIVHRLRAAGIDAVGYKPVITGAYTTKPTPQWSDAETLLEAGQNVEPLEKICPVRLEAAMAPVSAVRKAGKGTLPTLKENLEFLKDLQGRHKVVVGEGIGGLLVPLATDHLFVDLVKASGFSAVLVSRAGLGTINHTLLSINELVRQGIPIAGLIMCVTRKTQSGLASSNREEIEDVSKRKFDATIQYLEIENDPSSTLNARITTASETLTAQWDVAKLFK